MIQEVQVAPPNSVILLMDHTIGQVPDTMVQNVLAANDSCVAIGTLSESDGESFISLSDEAPPNQPKQNPVFCGILPTPSKRLVVCSIYDELLLSLEVPSTRTRVRIWINHPHEPNEIWIIAG